MTTQTEKRERRDWALLIFIIPIGILLILLVGQFAVRLVPFWSVNAGMNSNLEPDADGARPFALLDPILPQILTPMAWAETYLTPGADISFPPFLTFEPTASPSPTAATPSPTSSTSSPTATTSTPVPTSTTGTPPPPTGTEPPDGTGTPVNTSTPPTPTSSPTDTPTSTPTGTPTNTPTGTPTNTPSATPTDDPTLCNDSTASNVGDPLPCVYGTANNLTPMPTPTEVTGPPDGIIGVVPVNFYIVIELGVTVGTTPDNNYDLAFFEQINTGNPFDPDDDAVYLDWIIIGITNDPNGGSYYEVFNWGNGNPDTNTNVGDVAGTVGEGDNQLITDTDSNNNVEDNVLYDPDESAGPPPSDGPLPQSGILIDVDTAVSSPPPGTYNYVVVISPPGGGSTTDVDAIQTVEIPTPTP